MPELDGHFSPRNASSNLPKFLNPRIIGRVLMADSWQ
jgi:hypothetical protein